MGRSASVKIGSVVVAVMGVVSAGVAPSQAAGGGVAVVTDLKGYAAATSGPAVVEDFTDSFHGPLLGCRLDSTTRESDLQPGDIEPGVVFSTHCSDPEDFEFNIDSGMYFQGGFLDGFHQGERGDRRALRVGFEEPVSGFGFDTNSRMGRTFSVRVVHADGTVDVLADLPVTVDHTTEQFYGFVNDTADITRVRIVGRGDPTFGFVVDDFRFTPGA